jgi:hypothetical protein
MHPIKLNIRLAWRGSRFRLFCFYISHHICVAPALIYMVKFRIIARPLKTCTLQVMKGNKAPGGWRQLPPDYDTVGKAIWSCRKQQEASPWWQFSIIVVEFDCKVLEMCWTPRENYWWTEITSEKPVLRGREHFNAAQLAFLGGFDIGSPWGDCPTHTHPWECVA